MATIQGCILVAAVMVVSVQMSQGRPHKEQLRKHITYVNSFKCQPQPRSYLASSLFGDQLPDSGVIRPFYTILHRCDIHSGCCSAGYQCGPASQPEQLRLTFFVNNTYQTITALNHTECACLPIISLPKR